MGHPNARSYRVRALVQAVIAGAIAGLIYWKWRHPLPVIVILSIAGTVLALALAWPGGYEVFDRGVKRFAVWIGTAVTWILLAPFFYLCFGGAGVWLRLRRRDPLRRRYDPSRKSYWEDRPPVEGPSHYERQY